MSIVRDCLENDALAFEQERRLRLIEIAASCLRPGDRDYGTADTARYVTRLATDLGTYVNTGKLGYGDEKV